MAINLWKTGGKPISYNPLPTGFTSSISLGIGSYVVSFRAKSASNAQLEVYTPTYPRAFDQTINLNSNYQTYQYSFSTPKADALYFYDAFNRGDIIIDNIQLVLKPLPKLTINAVDGFMSGKWNLHANAKVIDDTTLVLNASAGFQNSTLDVPVNGNQTYQMICNITGGAAGYIDITWKDSAGTTINTSARMAAGTNYITVTTPNNAAKGTLNFCSTASGVFTFTKPMLVLGSIPIPYESKRGDKMMIPTPKKNMFNKLTAVSGYFVTTDGTNLAGGANQFSSDFINVKGNTYYVCSQPNPSGYIRVAYYDANKTFIRRDLTASGVASLFSFITPSNAAYAKVSADNYTDSFQLEQGTIPTVYNSYYMQQNKKPQKYVTKKNIINNKSFYNPTYANTYASTVYDSVNDLIVTQGVSGVNYGQGQYIPLTPNTNYILSFDVIGQSQRFAFLPPNGGSPFADTGLQTIGTGKTFSFNSGNYTYAYVSFLTNGTSGIYGLRNVQLEKGSVATPYEPYKLILPPIKTGLSFNGINDYLQLPSMTMDSIEIECNIDANQNLPFGRYFIDARNGSPNLANGYVYENGIGTGFTSLTVDGVNKPSKLWTDIPKGQRTKVKVAANTFTSGLFIFGQGTNTSLKGIIYKVTCYLNNNIVAQYDFENPKNIVGNTVLNSAQNLIPNFEDSRWTIHANAKVMGKDVLHLDATAINQTTRININVQPSKTYLFNCFGNSSIEHFYIDEYDINNSKLKTTGNPISSGVYNVSFTTLSNTAYIVINLANDNTGSFDFIRPQLYQLTGKEGTISGNPIQKNKQAKRKLYSKR